jgi:small-conductance mechanosensitive channel
VVGDTIGIGVTQGEVVSVDLLSVKLRTLDNLLVPIPTRRSSSPRSRTTRATRFAASTSTSPSRSVRYIANVRALLEAIADDEPLCFDEPRPQFVVRRFSHVASSCASRLWTQLTTPSKSAPSCRQRMQEVFEREGVELPAVTAVAGRQERPRR